MYLLDMELCMYLLDVELCMTVSVGCGGKHVCVHTGHPENHDLQRMWKFI